MFESRCETSHAKLLSGTCPWCGHAVVDGRVVQPKWTSDSRTIRFEFHGGFKDGQVVFGKPSRRDEATPLLLRYLYLTDGGRVGVRFDEMPQNEADRAGLRELYAKDAHAEERSQKLLLLDFLYAKDLDIDEQLRKLLDSLCAKEPHAVEHFQELGRFFRQTYEVTKRDEGPDEIVVRVDFVEQHKP